jgi:hypothetical protein
LQWVAGLNPAESAWVIANPLKAPSAWWNKTTAEDIAKQIYMCQSNGQWFIDVDRTNQNAFKHAYWSALNQRSFGSEEAKTIGDNHEVDETSPDLDVQMDVWNNALGRKVAETCGCNGLQLEQAVSQAIGMGLGKRRQMGATNDPVNFLINTSSAATLCNGY